MRILVVNAGSSSLKLSVLDGDDVVAHRRRRPRRRSSRRSTGSTPSGTGSCTAAPNSPNPVVIDDDVERRLLAAHPARAAAPAARRAADPRGARTPARRAARRVLRHRVPRDDAGRREDVRAAQGVARTLAAATVRLPRSVARLCVAHRRGPSSAVRVAELRTGDVPPRRGRVAVRGARRPVGRHDDGNDPARRARHGDARREHRSRARASGCSSTAASRSAPCSTRSRRSRA